MKYVGITETYDPCFVPDWETKLLEANVVISKELSDEMVEKLLIVQDRVNYPRTKGRELVRLPLLPQGD